MKLDGAIVAESLKHFHRPKLTEWVENSKTIFRLLKNFPSWWVFRAMVAKMLQMMRNCERDVSVDQDREMVKIFVIDKIYLGNLIMFIHWLLGIFKIWEGILGESALIIVFLSGKVSEWVSVLFRASVRLKAFNFITFFILNCALKYA